MLFSLVAVVILVGCGGGTTNSDSNEDVVLDNSQLTTVSNAYGYFGVNVVFGDKQIVGRWTREMHDSGDYATDYDADSEHLTVDPNLNLNSGTYGVSKDGTILNSSVDGEIKIIDKYSVSCFNIEVTYDNGKIESGLMCKR